MRSAIKSTDCQYTRFDLERVVPFANEESIGEWDNVEQAIEDFNAVIAVIHAEHPCCTEDDISDSVRLMNAAYEEFCGNDGDAEKTIAYVRASI